MIFDPKNKAKLDDPERKKILPPEEILIRSGLKPSTTIADIGCGTGFFAIPASQIVGPSGKVYACDVSLEMLQDLETRCKNFGISNIKLIHSKQYQIPIENEAVDFVLISNVLHEQDNKVKFLSELNRILKSRGKLILIDWLFKEMEQGPPISERLTEQEIEDLIHKSNFVVLEKSIISDSFNYYLAEKI
ncbi:MAG: class I SAM-dependent methyltransferase [Ignavibacteria bacterium]|nr:class I SAM-dependent methyltransferase [Ignavibacteria bacterium]